MSRIGASLSVRLAVMFALVSTLLLGSIGFYLYYSLQRELIWRDDQSLLGRLEHMQALLGDSDSIANLRNRPQLYANMLGNQDSLLWVLDSQGEVLISVNPADLPLPTLGLSDQSQLGFDKDHQARLAWRYVEYEQKPLLLIAGKQLEPRNQMLAAYRLKLLLAMAAGALAAFMLGWLVSRRGLRPVRLLARQAETIDVQRLHRRLNTAHLPRELQTLGTTLNQMLARLEGGFEQLSRFSEDLAHEIRTPLSNLMGHTEHTLRKPRSTEEYESLLASHQEEYERLARMVDSMLFLARAEQPKASINRQSLDLNELAEQLCEYFEGVAEDEDMQLLNQAEGIVWADPDLLRRALANLLANALRYGRTGGAVVISSSVEQGHCVVRVHNQGALIGQDHLPRLFDRFYRCDASRTNSGNTGGLGLAIVRSIMQLHEGRVWVESDEGGTAFMLAFPERTPAAD